MPHTPDSVQPPFFGDRARTPSAANPSLERPGAIGKVYLVGAGPGDPGLLTVRGQECLRRADVVLYDGLANDLLLQQAVAAECICVGKHGQTPIWTQADINDRLLDLARQGKRIVRLKGGDPAVFARTAEELEVLSRSGVPFEVVPGITAALAAASYVGIPITHRQHASAVAFITGQQQSQGIPQEIDWSALARFPGTLVFYMGVTTAKDWTAKLLGAGKRADTPAAIVRRCTWSDQTVVRCQLQHIAERLTPASRMRPPVIVIVGDVAALGKDFDWFSTRPLHGCGVLVTRPEHLASELSEQLRELGANVYHQPVMEITPPQDMNSLDAAIKILATGKVDGITFSSTNGVDGFMQRLWQLDYDTRILAGARLAAVGPATATQLERYHLRADIVSEQEHTYSAEGLLATLGELPANQTWIVTETNRSRDTLKAGLKQHGAQVVAACAYETREVHELRSSVRNALDSHQIQLVTVTSTAIAECAHALLEPYRCDLQPISLSAKISEQLRNMSWPPLAEATLNTTAALVAATCAASQALSANAAPP